MKIDKIIKIVLLLAVVIAAVSCDKPETGAAPEAGAVSASEEKASSAAAVDLSVPPPGSNADQAKWDSFDEEKKQESWAKYIDSIAASGDGVQEAAAETEQAEPAVKVPGSRSLVTAVTVGELKKAEMDVYYYSLGELKAGAEMRITPGSNGTVSSLYVSEGDFVEPGDLLFSLDNNDLVKNIERTSAKWNNDLELAEIKLNEAEDNYETSSSLFSRELISAAEYEKAKQLWEEAELNYKKIQLAKTSELENLQENLRTTLAISPGRGYISDISFKKGESVNSSDYVEIIDIEKIAVSILVPENIITRIKQGQAVLAKKASAPEYMLEGAVSSLGLKADSNRSYEVIAEFDNLDQKLLPGMLIEAQIQLLKYSPNFVVPKESVINEGSAQFIYIAVDGIAEKIPVETGQSRGELVQVRGPLNEGDLVVISGQTYLRKGASVNVVEKRDYLPERTEL